MEKHKILIVDDEPSLLKSLKRSLDREDRELFLAPDAEKGAQILGQQKNIKVILCDNRLPGSSGIDFLTKIKPRYPDTVRILVTGYPDLSTAVKAINKAHIWRYILKPLKIEELDLLLKQAIDHYKIVRENRLLLKIVKQQTEWLKILRQRYPEIVNKEMDKSKMYVIDEQKVSELVRGFMKKYYSKEE